MFRRLFRKKPANTEIVLTVLQALSAEIQKKNIPVIADDIDAGYDMAIDEVLALIDEAINHAASENDVNYSGAM